MKKFLTVFLSVILAAFVIVGTMPVALAADTYTVTFSAGDKGDFTDSLYQSYVGTYGAGSVTKTAIGNIKITVPAGDPMPNVPTAADVDLGSYNGKYYVSSGWEPTDATVTKNASFVVSYGAIVNGVEYSVRYVDAATGNDLASPVISVGNIGDVMTFTAKNIASYNYDSFSKSVMLTSDASANVLTFSYTSTGAAVQPTAQPAAATAAAGTAAAANDQAAAGAGDAAAGDNNETITDNNAPLSNGNGDNGSSETINDDQVPASNWFAENGGNTWVIVGGLAAAILIAALILFIIKKKKTKKA